MAVRPPKVIIMADLCYHCGQPLIKGAVFTIPENPDGPQFCCPACRLVFQNIHEHGLDDYYLRRSVAAVRPDERNPDYSGYDDSAYLDKHFSYDEESGLHSARFLIEGMHCSACAWLIEKQLRVLPGIKRVSINLHQKVILLSWQQETLHLSQILSTIFSLGYRPLDWNSDSRVEHYRQEKKYIQTRLGVAGLLMMQVGMLSIGLYAGDWQSIDGTVRGLLRTASAFLSFVVIVYCAAPFIHSAWNSVRNRHVNMDVPVALALILTWSGSVYATALQYDNVYYDTVTMFVFFLLISRFLELRSREPDIGEDYSVVPDTAEKILADGQTLLIPSAQLCVGDRILCAEGQSLPVDGKIVRGQSAFDESLFSGESEQQKKTVGDNVYAATINTDVPVDIKVTAVGRDCAVFKLEDLAMSADADKPAYAQAIDRFSPWFVGAVLLVAGLTSVYWFHHDSDKLFLSAVAVLVAACPCALSLATPVTISSSHNLLRRMGIVPKSSALLERLPAINRIVFDKTGTLTNSSMTIERIISDDIDEEQALQIAASLELGVTHPVARTITSANKLPVLPVDDTRIVDACGVEGVIAHTKYRLGRAAWCMELIDSHYSGSSPADSEIVLCSKGTVLARFRLVESIRPEAIQVIELLRKQGFGLSIFSGDCSQRVKQVADQLGIAHYRAGLRPEEKLDELRQLQQQGDVVLMAGDGMNDIPVMASADVSLAVADASSLNQNYADAVLLNDSLIGLINVLVVGEKARAIIRQNMTWAVSYNALAMPLAAMALLPPWLAAIGMSLSSLIVVLNAKRIKAVEKPSALGLLTAGKLRSPRVDLLAVKAIKG